MMKAFFDIVRARFGRLSQKQVDGINLILAATSGLLLRQRAYILATAWHETARTMQPIHERGVRAYFNKYEPLMPIGKKLGNTELGDGYRFRGRGYVQLTGRYNYTQASRRLLLNFVGEPDLALNPGFAATILVEGMAEGWFTGKRLDEYINEAGANYVRARRTVNGLDRANLIAAHARAFATALEAVAFYTA